MMKLLQVSLCFMLLTFVQGCSSLELAAISEEVTGRHQQGQIIWHDCITDDLEKNMQFYGGLLGWTFEKQGAYVAVFNSGVHIAGMVELKDEKNADKSGGWISYISMRDMEETAAWVTTARGNVLRGPGKMKNRGTYAMIGGPQDEPLMLLDLKNGDPLPKPAPLGGWLWLELWTDNVGEALDFYQALGGFSAEKTSEEGEEEYWVLIDTEGRWQAGITVSPFGNIPSQWVPVVRVENPAEIVQKVEKLGGRVIIKPNHPLTDGKIALIEDPTGGIFMVESWEKTQTEPEQ